jgi:alpha-tubulin suppressor-like RCC1 family protein
MHKSVVASVFVCACAQITTQPDSGVDAGADALVDVAAMGCKTSSDCASSTPVCSSSSCVSVISLSRGMSDFQCAVLSDRTARCWGDANSAGELGNGVTLPSSKPVTVLDSNGTAPLPSVQTIVTGLNYGCALTLTGDVYCWGTDPSAPGILPTFALTNVKQISGAAGINPGQGSVCAIRSDATMVCWGFNAAGRIGCTGSSVDDAGACTVMPVSVVPSSSLTSLASASAIGAGTSVTCSTLGATRQFECWGNDEFGGFGDGTAATSCCTTGMGSLTVPIIRIEPSDLYMCAEDNNADWHCWGDSPGGALLGVAPNTVASSPVAITTSPIFLDFSPGWYHGCAIMASGGTVQCWGQNDHGQMGNGTTSAPPTYQTTPVTVTGLSGVAAIAAHRNFTCALGGDGQVYCWGQNVGYTLGAGSTSTDVTTPQVVKWD